MRDQTKTQRLTLRRPDIADAHDMAGWINQYDVAKQTGTICHPHTYLHAEFWVMISRNYWNRRLAYNYVIENDGRVIGSIGLFRPKPEVEFEVGYMLSQTFWGQGLMTEAVKALLITAREDLGLMRCHAGVFSDNPGSAALLKKIGFALAGEDAYFSVARGKTASGNRYVCELAPL